MPGFILIAISLLLVAIYLTFSFLSVLFSAEKKGKILILVILILFSFSFLLSQGLVHSFDSLSLSLFYLVSALGVGLLFYLTASAILFYIIRYVWPHFLPKGLAKIGAVLAVSLFLIGVLNASSTEVKNISVNLKGLPANWQGKKIVQISDIHLGSIYGPGFLRKQIAKVNALNPDLVVITGDLFDGNGDRLPEFGKELLNLKAKEGVIFVSGNHDVYLGLDKIGPLLKNANIKFLRDEMINLNGLEIIGFDFTKFAGDDTMRTIKNLSSNTGLARLLLNHTPTDIPLAKSLKVNLQLSGHSHRGQMFPMSLLTRMLYGKYQYGLHSEGSFNIYTSSGLGSWGPPVRTFNPAEIVSIIIN